MFLITLPVILALTCIAFAQSVKTDIKPVYTLDVKGVINPFTAKYTLRGIDHAERHGAQLVVLQLDTPGGLDTSMRDINTAILNSRIPVVVYVAPKGARAASAGVFITYASDIAAMSPGTNIGAAHHVNIGGGDSGSDENDSWIKQLLDLIEETQKRKEEKDKQQEKQDQFSSEPTPDKTPSDVDVDIPEEEQPVSSAPIKKTPPSESGKPKSQQEVMAEKITNDAVAGLRAIAELKGRNADWAERAIRESESIASSEALEIGVVEYIADSVEDLLRQIDGVTIVKSEREYTLNTAAAPVKHLPMSAIESLMLIITDPQIAYFLLLIGIYGLIYEVTHPGALIPGVLGGTSLILAILAFNYLPITAAGVVLLVLGILFMIAEMKVPGIGILAVAGVICFLLGSFLLIDRNYGEMVIRPESYLPMAVLSIILLVIILPRIYKSVRGKVITGIRGLEQAVGVVAKELTPEGKIYVHGEYWNAKSLDGSMIEKDKKVIVIGKDEHEMMLIVKSKDI